MKTVIVYNHPYNGSFCHALLEAAVAGSEKAGNTVDVIDLDSDNFDPVMTGADLLAFRNHEMIDWKAKEYVARIRQADHLVFIFPIWWELMPAMMKGFIDKVIFPGSTYSYTKSGYGMNTLLTNLKTATVITTMNTPKIMYSTIYGNALKKAMVKGTLKKSGFKNVHWVSFNMVKSSKEATRKKWLAKVENIFYKK
ncbi:NAD(P)H-dependent oxidoreductase [Enterococcus sp. AZ196]|uniref:NAD(P)H-dependent oxidoreductase n=1 Tax=Enterococcus sp. AZ196 TaxID=2774659 RepID=UPI003D2DFB70